MTVEATDVPTQERYTATWTGTTAARNSAAYPRLPPSHALSLPSDT